jgi:hypothetical protein
MRKSVHVLAAVAVLFGAAAGISYATNVVTRTSTSVLQACANGTNGNLRLVADSQTGCRTNETGVSWNVVGPAGVAGKDGINGTDGTNGVSPTVQQLAAADPNCPTGGVSITDAAGRVGYVCDGAKGDAGANGSSFGGTFVSPNGLYSLRVLDSGIEMRGPSANISLASASLDIRAGASLDIRSGVNLLLEGVFSTLKGNQVTVGSSTCAPPVRQGDPMFVVVPSGAGGAFPVTVVPTPSTVCLG